MSNMVLNTYYSKRLKEAEDMLIKAQKLLNDVWSNNEVNLADAVEGIDNALSNIERYK